MDYFIKAEELYKNQDYEKSIEFYEKSLDNNVNEVNCLYNIGVCYIKLKEYEKAIIYIEKALLIRKDSRYYFNIGYCYAILKNNEISAEYFKKSLKLNPYDEDTKKALVELKKRGVKIKEEDNTFDIEIDNLSNKDKISMLMAKINLALDMRNEEMFIEFTNELNKLK